MATLNIDLEQLQIFLMVFLRVGAFLMAVPLFGAKNVPVVFKTGLALSVSVAVFPMLNLKPSPYFFNAISFGIGVASEIMLGAIVGFSVNILFAGIQLAGQLAGYQMGFAIANVMDPQSGVQSSIISGLLNMTAILLFLVFNAHHWLLRSLVESFHLVPLFTFHFSGTLTEHFITLSGNMFIVAIKVAAPVMAALLITSLCLGIIARTVPKMNIFLVGMPLKIAMGFIFISLSLPYLAAFLKQIFGNLGESINTLLKLV